MIQNELQDIINKGIELFRGDKEAFFTVLSSYARNTPPLIEKLTTVNIDNLQDYGIIIHGIKSSSRSIAAYEIGDDAEALEHAAKKGDIGFIAENNERFINDVNMFIGNLNEILNDNKKQKPQKDAPAKEALLKLLDGCNNYDIDKVDSAIEEIDSFIYTNDNGLGLWLKQNVTMMNFKEITERLKDI